MLFNSLHYLLFLPIVFVLYWALNSDRKRQNVLLLISSYVFYGWWDWRFLFLIIFSSFVDYYIGQKIHEEKDSDLIRKRWLYLSLISNLGLLGVFKYFNFFTGSFVDLMHVLGWEVNELTINIILPVGISFYTFQTLSYTIDVYRRNIEPCKDVVSFFTYVSFFPQLVAGPIERASNLIPQIESQRVFSFSMFKAGLLQISVGLFRKVVIADNLAHYVDSVYGNAGIHNSTTLLFATVFYAFQIYFDFSGYSDIAIGSAKLLGFRFRRNFNLPYFSTSLTEFWRRWHISLSSWLRDYLYISLGGNRRGIKITYRNLLITMLLGGLWHGSSWNFVIWGGIHGLALSFEKYIFANTRIKSFNFLGYFYTFVVVIISWVFFRAADLPTALVILKQLFSFNYAMPYIGDVSNVVRSVLMLATGLSFDLFLFRRDVHLEELGENMRSWRVGIVVAMIVLFVCLFCSTSDNFIYFQF